MRTIVVYAKPGRQTQVPVDVPEGATVLRVIELSGLLKQFPDIDLEKQKVGSFGKFLALDALVEEGMRIEIYRPITINPATVPRRPTAKPAEKD
ncbi:MAG: RnfH family protein [Rhodospirillaceae bacterium]